MTALHRRTTPLVRQLALFVGIVGFLALVAITYPTGHGVVMPPGAVGVYDNFDQPTANPTNR